MRTTLTIDDDLAGLLKKRARELGACARDQLRAGTGGAFVSSSLIRRSRTRSGSR